MPPRKCVYMVFDGFVGINKKVWSEAKGKYINKLLMDVKCGSLIGIEPFMYTNCPSMFTIQTSEKSKFLEISAEGFTKYIRSYIQDRHDRMFRFLRKQPILKEIRH